MGLRTWLSIKKLRPVALGLAVGVVICFSTATALHETSKTSFCISCHEMRVVAEQGWMHSEHYQNEAGVVAGCSDCHVPPEFFPKMWTKTRDGIKDIWVHNFGESDPNRMDWDALALSARAKIYDSACKKCHQDLTPKGASIKTLVAHRENQRLDEPKKCLECHREEFHGKFRLVLDNQQPSQTEKGER